MSKDRARELTLLASWIAVTVAVLPRSAIADFNIATGLKWVPLHYKFPPGVGGNSQTGPPILFPDTVTFTPADPFIDTFGYGWGSDTLPGTGLYNLIFAPTSVGDSHALFVNTTTPIDWSPVTGCSGTFPIANGTIFLQGPIDANNNCQVKGTTTIFGNVSITGSGNMAGTFGPNGFTVSGNLTINSPGTDIVNPFTNQFGVTGTQIGSFAPFVFAQSPTTPDPISIATGELLYNSGRELSLGFRRFYGSYLALNGVTSSLGTNWMHSFDQKLYVSGNQATVVLFGGGMVQFKQSGSAWQVSSLGRLAWQLVNSGGGYRFLHPGQNLIYTFSSTGDLTKIEDRNGNAYTVTPSPSGPTQVSDGLGRTLSFSYTGGKLSKVQDQAGRAMSFTNTSGNLTGVTDALGNTTTFSYTSAGGINGLMTSSIRPGGNKPYTQVFDGNGRVSQQMDSLGNKTTLAYNSGSPGTTVMTDPLSHATKYAYQNLMDLSSYSDAAGKSGSISYDALLRPISSTDRLGNKSSVAYDKASGYPASVTDAQGNTTTFIYTSQPQGGFTFYNLTKIAYADGTSASITYDASGNVLTATDRGGKTATLTYNSRGQVLTAKNVAGGVTTYSYNSDATLASAKSPAGDVTAYSYDNAKRPLKVLYADNTSASLTWDALDQLLSVTDERGKVTKLAYDPNTNLKSVTDALNQSAGLAYDTDDLVSKATDRLGKATAYQYDAIGSVTAATNPAGEKNTFSYDTLERLKAAADPSGKGPSFSYDAEGRLATATDAVANTSNITVDKLGRTTRVSTPLAENFDTAYDAVSRVTAAMNALSQKTSFSYENRDLVTGITLPGGISASYTWGDLPVLTGITDPNGNNWTLAYDNLGRLNSATDPLGQATSYTYDQRNRVASVTNPVGTAQLSYDAAGNLTQQQYSDNTTRSFTYDDDNRITGGNGVSLSYDAAGRIVSSNGLSITRDDVGRIASIAYPPGAVTYTYNTRGLLAAVSDWAGGTTTFAYDDARRLVSITRPNGVVTQYSYDQDSRVASITETGGGNTLASIALQRDALGRVTSANRTLPQTPTVAASGTLPLGYDAANQVAGFTYDGIGRLTNGDLSSTYVWDMGSRLMSYSRADGIASFTYDDFGMRISRTGADGTTKNYVLNYALGLPSIAIIQSGGADLRYYVQLPDGSVLYSIEAADSTRHFFHFDEAGSTIFLTDDTSAITDSYGVTPYGEIVTQAGTTDNPFTFQGRFGVMQEVGTSLYYMRYRYYDSTAARFLTRDPVLSLGPREINPYQYAVGDPVANGDPMGLKTANFGTVLRRDMARWVVCAQANEDDITAYLNSTGGIFCSFSDVECPASDGAVTNTTGTTEWRYIGTMYRRGYTKGCASTGDARRNYCPNAPRTRGEMAVSIIRAKMSNVFPTTLNGCPAGLPVFGLGSTSSFYAPVYEPPANVVTNGPASPINLLPWLERLFVGTTFPATANYPLNFPGTDPYGN